MFFMEKKRKIFVWIPHPIWICGVCKFDKNLKVLHECDVCGQWKPINLDYMMYGHLFGQISIIIYRNYVPPPWGRDILFLVWILSASVACAEAAEPLVSILSPY